MSITLLSGKFELIEKDGSLFAKRASDGKYFCLFRKTEGEKLFGFYIAEETGKKVRIRATLDTSGDF
ncbi:hypothetical protein [Bacillus wiedmannii]|uniref:hypothetical protein n=1 Tax=Bacillus wiedmannii TaxID=1890302 RepID=UPI003D9869C7